MSEQCPPALPRVVISAPASGQGKTTVAVGLMAALTARGLSVSPGKVGPDYIDPGYHALATGRPGRNLDPWLVGEHRLAPLLAHAARTPEPADLSVVEGVMGLFDGRNGTDGECSTAHVARVLDAPVVLVVDASAASGTVAAVVHGLRTYDPRVRVGGVVLNQVGSERHAAEVRRWLERDGVPVLGALPRDPDISAPSRHLGLVPAAERDDAADALSELIARHLDLDAVLELARSASPLEVEPWAPPVAAVAGRDGRRPVVAVAGGRAFTFRYAETEELLRAAGCEVVTLDPAQDEALPSGVAGLYLAGGFPEMHAPALSTNRALLGEIRDAVAAGLPTVAECTGLLYLSRAVDDQPMAGVVPADATMSGGLTLGYPEARSTVDSVLGPAGTLVRGHEFHQTATTPVAGASPTAVGGAGAPGAAAWVCSVRGPTGFALDPAGTGRATVHASYLHVHWAGHPELAQSFAEACAHHDRTRDLPDRTRDLPDRTRDLPDRTRDLPDRTRDLPDRTRDVRDRSRVPWGEPRVPSGKPRVPSQGGEAGAGAGGLDHHGDSEVAPGLVDLAVNVRVAAPPSWLADVVRGVTDELAAYPDARSARSAIAARHGVTEQMVLPTAGAAEAFTLLARAGLGDRAVVVHPQFTEPEAALLRAGILVDRHLLTADDHFVLDPDALAPSPLTVLGNPTNPTGVLHPRESLDRVRARSGGVLVVDEAFLDEVVVGDRHSLIGAEMADLLVVRSLTKTWGLAGLRAGYVVGDPALVAALAAQQPPWSVSTPALAVMVATATPQAVEEAERLAGELVPWREHLVHGLRGSGLEVVPSQAPFVLARCHPGLREALRDHGYVVRRGDTFPGLGPEWIRLAVRHPDVTDGLLGALDQVQTRLTGH